MRLIPSSIAKSKVLDKEPSVLILLVTQLLSGKASIFITLYAASYIVI